MAKLTITALPARSWLFKHEGWTDGYVGVVLNGKAMVAHGKGPRATKAEAMDDARKESQRFGASKMPASIRQRYAYDR